MCLFIKKGQKAKIAEEDIVVYKHIMKSHRKGYTYETSYQHVPILIGETYTSELKVDVDDPEELYIGLHSFEKLEDAVQWANYYYEVVVQCIISKGSRYHRGMFNDD